MKTIVKALFDTTKEELKQYNGHNIHIICKCGEHIFVGIGKEFNKDFILFHESENHMYDVYDYKCPICKKVYSIYAKDFRVLTFNDKEL